MKISPAILFAVPALALSVLKAHADTHTAERLDARYPKVVIDQDIEHVMRDFSQDLGITVVVDREVMGAVRQMDADLSARRFLDRVAGSLSATWFFYDGYIYMTPLAEIDQAVFDVTRVSRASLEKALGGLKLQAGRAPLSFGVDDHIAIATGAPELLRLITDIVMLEGGKMAEETGLTDVAMAQPAAAMSVFRGRLEQ